MHKKKILHEQKLQIWFAETLMYLQTVSDLNHILHRSCVSAVKLSRYTSCVMWLHDERPKFRKPSPYHHQTTDSPLSHSFAVKASDYEVVTSFFFVSEPAL